MQERDKITLGNNPVLFVFKDGRTVHEERSMALLLLFIGS